MSAASAADDEAQALPLLPRDVDAMLGIGTAHQALPVHVPARSLEAGAEAATLTEPEAHLQAERRQALLKLVCFKAA